MHKHPDGSIAGKDILVIDTANDYAHPIQQLSIAQAWDPGPFTLCSTAMWAYEPEREHDAGDLENDELDFSAFNSFLPGSMLIGE